MRTGWGPPRFIRVYGAWIALVTGLVMGAAVGASSLVPPDYESTATVVVEARVRANTTPVAPDMGTEKELAQSGVVISPAARLLATSSADLLDGLSVSVAPDANVLTFTYRHRSAAEARRRAQAVSVGYVTLRNAGETAARGSTTAPIQHATLVTAATLPVNPATHPMVVYLGVGLLVGLLTGTGTALLRDRMNDRLRGRDDFARVSGTEVLATVPRRKRKLGDPRLVVLRHPTSPAAESFRYLRSRLQPLLPHAGVLLVTSAGEGEGRTTTAANLAIAVAQAGHNVVLVDADLRNPCLHALFDRNSAAGLAGVLAGWHRVDEALVPTAVPRLTLLPAGPLPGNAGDLLDGDRLRWVLDGARAHADVVIVDSGAVLSSSDSVRLAAASDHVLLVADHRRTTRAVVARMLAELGGARVGDMSAVLLNVPRRDGGLIPKGRPTNTTLAEVPATDRFLAPGVAASPPARMPVFPTAGHVNAQYPAPAGGWGQAEPPTFEPPLREATPTLHWSQG